MKFRDVADGVQESDQTDKPTILDKPPMTHSSSQRDQQDGGVIQQTEAGHTQSRKQLIDENGQCLSDVPPATMSRTEASTSVQSQVSNAPGTTDLASIDWSYLDTQGIVQGEWL